jgi:hypothetical protein
MERFRWEGADALAPHTIVFDFTSAGPGFGKGGAGILRVDGAEVASNTIPHTIPTIMPWDETFHVGVDTRTGVAHVRYGSKAGIWTSIAGVRSSSNSGHFARRLRLAPATDVRTARWSIPLWRRFLVLV